MLKKMLRRGVQCTVALAAVSLVAMIAVGAPEGERPEPPAPEGQSYTGSKKCSACHFEQYLSWKKTKHSKSFELLPAQYQADAKCLKCHTTGFGVESGYDPSAPSASLAGTTCESCHGPGSKHEEVCKDFAKAAKLTPEQEKAARDSIWKMLPKNVCVECHTVQGHHKSETPKGL